MEFLWCQVVLTVVRLSTNSKLLADDVSALSDYGSSVFSYVRREEIIIT